MSSMQHVHWRGADGKPQRGQPRPPTSLLNDWAQSKHRDKQDGLGWLYRISKLEAAMRPLFLITGPDGQEMNERTSWRLMKTAIDRVTTKLKVGKSVNPSDLLGLVEAEAADYFAQPLAAYELVTSLAVKGFPPDRVSVNGCVIESLVERGVAYSCPESIRAMPAHAKHVASSEYRLVRVQTRGRCPDEAVDRALDAINLLRGIWTLVDTYTGWTRRFGSERFGPVGVVHIGPVHTLHPCASEGSEYWFEHSYRGDRPLFEPKRGWDKIEEQRTETQRLLESHPFREDVERLIIRYVSALDQPELSVALLQLWALLEKMTGTIGEKYDETINRATWHYADVDRESARAMLNAIRIRRNMYVHAARTGEEVDQSVYLMKCFVDPHLKNLIVNSPGLRTLDEYGEFLSLPTQTGKLVDDCEDFKRRIELRTVAIELLSGGDGE